MRLLALLVVAAATSVPAYALMQADGPDTVPPVETQVKGDDTTTENRVICRRVEVTGSLVKRGRVCRTVREWRTIGENGNYNARKMVDESTSRSGGN